ncbi:ExeM/NucH family extracellular endonuclease [Pseudomonas aeruginosa]
MAGLPARHLRQPRPAWRWRARRRRGGRPATDPRGAGRRRRKSAGEPAGRHRGRGGRRLPERQRAEGLLRAAGRCHGGRRPGDLRRHLRLRRRQRQRRQARRPRPGDRPGPRVQRPHRTGRAAAGQRPGERRGLADAGRHQPAAGQRRCAGALRRHARAAPPDADRQRGLQPRPLRRGPAVLRRPPDDSDQRGGSRRTGQGHAGAQRPRPDSPRRRPQRAEPRPDPLPGTGTERLQQPARRRPYQRHRRRARLLGRQLPYPAVADADLRGGQSASGPAGGGRAPAGGQLQRAQLLQRRWQGRRFPTSRGANTAEEFQRQKAKIVAAILASKADIVGLMEIENDGYGEFSAIADLVNGLNASLPQGQRYAFVNPNRAKLGSDEIAVGLIYRGDKVRTYRSAAVLDSSVNPEFDDTRNRPTLAQTFQEINGGERLTIAVNHLKSKGSACDGDPDTGDGQGNCNLTRARAAQALVDWLAGDPTGAKEPDRLIIGDLNSYAKEDPVNVIRSAGYTDLVARQAGAGKGYSYVFSGQSGYLDHALANASLARQVRGAVEWHINADEPRVLDYNVEFKTPRQQDSLYNAEPYRASDHDPVVIGIDLRRVAMKKHRR